MNRDRFNLFAVIGAAVLLIAVIATVVILDKAGVDIVDIPDFSGDKSEVTTDTSEGNKKDPDKEENDKDSESNDNEEESSKNDKTESGNNDSTSGGNADGEKPSKDKTDKEDTKKPSQNDSSDKKEPFESGNAKDTERGETEDSDKPYVPEPLTYAEFIAMSPYDQQAYFESFENIQDYFDWYNNALAEYEKEQNKQEADGPIDIGEIINGGNN